ncbi:hypothetical protein, partial [Sinomonas atrocyanea]
MADAEHGAHGVTRDEGADGYDAHGDIPAGTIPQITPVAFTTAPTGAATGPAAAAESGPTADAAPAAGPALGERTTPA